LFLQDEKRKGWLERHRKALILSLLGIIGAATTVGVLHYSSQDEKAPEIRNMEYKKEVAKSERQEIAVSVNEKNPAQSLLCPTTAMDLTYRRVPSFLSASKVLRCSQRFLALQQRTTLLSGYAGSTSRSGIQLFCQVTSWAPLRGHMCRVSPILLGSCWEHPKAIGKLGLLRPSYDIIHPKIKWVR